MNMNQRVPWICWRCQNRRYQSLAKHNWVANSCMDFRRVHGELHFLLYIIYVHFFHVVFFCSILYELYGVWSLCSVYSLRSWIVFPRWTRMHSNENIHSYCACRMEGESSMQKKQWGRHFVVAVRWNQITCFFLCLYPLYRPFFPANSLYKMSHVMASLLILPNPRCVIWYLLFMYTKQTLIANLLSSVICIN